MLLYSNVEAQWQPIGPYGGYFNSLASSGNTVYGFLSDLTVFPWVENKLLAKDNLLFLLRGGQIFRSTNSGKNFSAITDSSYSLSSWIVNGNYLYATTYYKGLLKSTNNGINWISIKGNLQKNYFNKILSDGINLYVCADSCIAKSSNDGVNWTIINGNLPLRKYWSMCLSNNILFVAIEGMGIYKTSNYGLNLFTCNQGLVDNNFYDIIANGNTLYIKSDSERIFKSTNFGINWYQFDNGLIKGSYNNFINSGQYIIYSSNDYFNPKIFRTLPSDIQWYESITGLSGLRVRNIISVGSKLYASCFIYGLYSSSNNGDSWSKINTLPQDSEIVYVNSIGSYPNNRLFIGFNHSILFSTNNGNNWVKSNMPNDYFNSGWLSTIYNKSNFLLAGAVNYGILKSTDNGINWFSSGQDINNCVIFCFYELNGNIFTGTGAGVFESTNNGVNWINKSDGITGGMTVYALNYIGNRFIACNEEGLYFSTNFGNNWIKHNSLQFKTLINGVNNNFPYLLGCTPDSILTSYDYGNTWIHRNQNLESYDFNSLSIINNYVFTCSDKHSIWRKPLQEVISVKNISSELPSKFELYQNYPNPFNPTTKIKFEIPSLNPPLAKGGNGGVVTLKVYDILGKEIETLVNEKKSPGIYEVTFNGSSLASGIYFYKLTAGEFRETKKLILLK